MKARALSRLWQSLESIPGLLEVPAAWEAACGPDFALLRPHLRVTDTEGALYPCPRAPRAHCPRRIVDLGDGEYIAICRDPLRVCEDVPLAASDVLLHAVDLGSLSRMLATPLGVRWQPPELRGDGTWGIGLSERRDSRGQPVFLIVLPDTARFVTAVQRLTRIGSGPFVLAAPTNRHHTIEAQELLHSRGATFLPLEDHVLVNEAASWCPRIPRTPRRPRRLHRLRIASVQRRSLLVATSAKSGTSRRPPVCTKPTTTAGETERTLITTPTASGLRRSSISVSPRISHRNFPRVFLVFQAGFS